MKTDASVAGDRLVAWLGVASGLPLLLLDAWFLGLGSTGRAGFVAALGRPGAIHLAIGAVLFGTVAVHGALAAVRARRAERGDPGAFGNPGHRVLQWTTAGIGVLFVLVHVFRHSPVAAALEGLSAAALYERMRHELSRPFFVALYVVGVGSLCLHAFQGIVTLIDHLGRNARDQIRRLFVFLALLGCIAIFATTLDGLSHYVAGKALVARPRPDERGLPSALPDESPR